MIKLYFLLLCFPVFATFAQNDGSKEVADRKVATETKLERGQIATSVKNQQQTGTCWSFSTTSLLESQAIHNNLGAFDLSEMFYVRNIYIEKAKNYILRQGRAQFGEGGLGHDVIRATATYGAMPLDIYEGFTTDSKEYNHSLMIADLKNYLDTVLKHVPIPSDWLNDYVNIINKYMGTPPSSFDYKNKSYTPVTFARDVLRFNSNDYVYITSFTHHPYYQPFIIEVPDNFSNGSYYNVPLKEMMDIIKNAINSGYTVLWDADVSNSGFRQKTGYALYQDKKTARDSANANAELPYNETERQQLYENLTTQDDHLMHITGMEKSSDGKVYYIVKNSWGLVGPFKGYIKVSEAYIAMNTISLVVPKAGVNKGMQEKLGVK